MLEMDGEPNDEGRGTRIRIHTRKIAAGFESSPKREHKQLAVLGDVTSFRRQQAEGRTKRRHGWQEQEDQHGHRCEQEPHPR